MIYDPSSCLPPPLLPLRGSNEIIVIELVECVFFAKLSIELFTQFCNCNLNQVDMTLETKRDRR